MTTSKPKMTVALPTLGRDQVMVDTIRDILKQDFDSFELVVVDQTKAHDDKTAAFLKNLSDPRFRYFLVSPPSLTAARNFALAKAAADIVLFLDDDIELHNPYFIDHIYRAFAKDPEIAAVSGRVVNKDNSLFVQVESQVPLSHDKYGMGRDSFNCPVSQFATDFPGGNMALKKSAIVAVGGFDPSFKGNAIREESDAAHRLIKAGHKIYYEASSAILHLAAPTGGSRIHTSPFDNQIFYTNDLLFMFKSVRVWNLPVALAKRYHDAIRGQSFGKIVSRSGLFLGGMVNALRYRLFPDQTVCQEVSS